MSGQVEIQDVDGERVRDRAADRCPAVVLLHPGPGSAAAWRAVSERLALRYRTVAVDGSGRDRLSDRQPLETDIDQDVARLTGVVSALDGPAHLVGYAFGAAVVLRTALIGPTLVRSLTLVEPQVYPILRVADAPDLPRVVVPTVVIQSTDSTAADRRMCRFVADGIPGARLVVVGDADDMRPPTQPSAVAEALLAHVDAMEGRTDPSQPGQ